MAGAGHGEERLESKVWRAPGFGAAEFLRGAFVDYAYDPHTHDAACFALITAGAIRIRICGEEFVARSGDIFAIEAGGVHAGWPIDGEGWRLRTLYVGLEELIAATGERTRAGAGLSRALIRDPRLAADFHRMHSCAEAEEMLAGEEKYLDFAARLGEHHLRERTAPPAVGREGRAVRLARDFLDAHLAEGVRLAEIADVAGLPRFRLLRAFTRAVGMPPHAYQRQARVRRAACLIRRGLPLSAVAAEAGFADQAHMTRLFRRMMGVTPGTYRAAFV